MAKKHREQEFAVIGLGRFGASVALTLAERGFSVMGIDIDKDLVQRYSDDLTHTAALDASNEEALISIDIASFDTVVLAMAKHFENSILAAVALKKLGVRRVICKALTERQAEILLRVGADRVILPESEAGRRLALELAMPQLLDSMVLGAGYGVSEVTLPAALVGRTLAESQIHERYGFNVLVVKSGDKLLVSPPADYIFAAGDLLVVFGADVAISQFSQPE